MSKIEQTTGTKYQLLTQLLKCMKIHISSTPICFRQAIWHYSLDWMTRTKDGSPPNQCSWKWNTIHHTNSLTIWPSLHGVGGEEKKKKKKKTGSHTNWKQVRHNSLSGECGQIRLIQLWKMSHGVHLHWHRCAENYSHGCAHVVKVKMRREKNHKGTFTRVMFITVNTAPYVPLTFSILPQ